MRGRWLVVLLRIGGAAGLWRRRRRRPDSGEVVPKDARQQEALVDLASEDSFPASDPPSYWRRDAG